MKVFMAYCLMIAPIRLFTPMMFLICLRSIFKAGKSKSSYWKGSVLFWAKLEVLFYLWSMNKRRKLNNIQLCLPTLTREERTKFMKQIFQTADMVFRGGTQSKKVEPLKTIASIANFNKGPSGPSLLQLSMSRGPSGVGFGGMRSRVMSMEEMFRVSEEMRMENKLPLRRRSTNDSIIDEEDDDLLSTEDDFGGNDGDDDGWSESSSKRRAERRFLTFKRADFCSWFGIHDHNELYRGNIEEWVRHYGVLPLSPAKLNDDESRQVALFTDQVVSFLELKPKRGYNKRIRSMMYVTDPVLISHRPFLQYVIVRAFQNIANYFWATKNNFTKYKSGIFSYWYRPPLMSPPKGAQEPLPLVFVHGLGLGATTLFLPGFMQAVILALNGEFRQIIVLSFPHLQQRPGWEDHVPTTEETTATIKMIFAFHKMTHAHFIAHSLGTVIASWWINRTDFVKCLTFVDPVCITLLRSDIIRNNIYKPPERVSEALLRFFVFRESTTAAVICRNMYSLQNVFDFESANCPMCFMVGGMDPIVPGYSVMRLLQYQKSLREADPSLPLLEVAFEKSYNHGSFLLHSQDVLPQIIAVDAAAHRMLREKKSSTSSTKSNAQKTT